MFHVEQSRLGRAGVQGSAEHGMIRAFWGLLRSYRNLSLLLCLVLPNATLLNYKDYER